MADLHNAIMNLPAEVERTVFANWTRAEQNAYNAGHRDARHSAAELVSEAMAAKDARIAELEAQLEKERQRTVDAGDAHAMVEVIARRAVMAAEKHGKVLTITQVPRQPLAMGNYKTVVEVRPARVRS